MLSSNREDAEENNLLSEQAALDVSRNMLLPENDENSSRPNTAEVNK
jgi:hypothetical protein